MKKIIQLTIYLTGAISLCWPMAILAAGTAFGADNPPSYKVLFGTYVVAMILYVMGVAALLKKRLVSKALISCGPFLACVVLVALAVGPFKEPQQRLHFILIPFALNLAAITTGLLASSTSQGATLWPQ
jgi:hypothetical protein